MRLGLLLAALVLASAPRAQDLRVAPTPVRDGLVERVRPDGVRTVEGPLSASEVEARLGGTVEAGARRGGGFVVSFDVPEEVDNVAALAVPDGGGRVTAVGFYTDAVTALAPDGTPLWTTFDPGCGPYDVDDRGGVVVVACVRGRRVLVLDGATGAVRHRIATAGGVALVRLSADGTRAVAGMSAQTLAASRLLIVDTDLGRVDRSLPAPFQGSGFTFPVESNRDRIFFTDIAISDDGSRVALAAFEGLYAFDADTGASRLVTSANWIPETIELTADGGVLLATYGILEPSRADFHDLDAGTVASVPLPADTDYPSAALLPDGSAALVALNTSLQILGPARAPTTVLETYVGVEPLGQGRALARTPYDVSYIDLASGVVLTSVVSYYGGYAGHVHDGRTSAWTADFEDIRLHDLGGDPVEVRLRPGADPEADGARFLALSADGARVAVTHTLSHQVGVYDAATFEPLGLYTLDGPTSGVTFLPGDTELLVAAGQQVVRLDAATGAVLQTLYEPGRLGHVVVRAGRAFVYVGGGSGVVQIYDLTPDGLAYLATAPVRSTLSTNLGVGTVPFFAVTPDGRRVLGISPGDNTVRVFDVEAQTITEIPVAAFPWGINVSADSRYAIAIDFDQRAYMISLGDVPALEATVFIPGLSSYTAAYDGVRKGFWVGREGQVLDALLLDPATGAILDTRRLGARGLLHELMWTPETGLAAAVTGDFQLYAGSPNSYATFGRLITEAQTVNLSTAPAQLAGPTRFGEVLVTLPGPDGLAFAAGVPVSADAPAPMDLHLRALGNPSAGRLRVELDGPARAALRVEVVDVLGRVVGRLHDGAFAGGRRELVWEDAAPGAYLVRVVGEAISVRATAVR